MASKVEIQIQRYNRVVKKETVKIDPGKTTIGQLTRLLKEKYPAGLEFVDEAGDLLLNEEVVVEGKILIASAADKYPYLRESAEEAASFYKRMVAAGKKRLREGDKYCSRWMILVAPPSGLSLDGRFHGACNPHEYWVLWRENFEKLEGEACKLLFNTKLERHEYLLAGPAGTGKSHAVLALVSRLVRRADDEAAAAQVQQGSVAKRPRVIPILDCRELLKNFRGTVVRGIAAGFGDEPSLIDELVQLESDEDYNGFVRKYSSNALFVFDQFQYVEANAEIKARVDLLHSGHRALFVTSAGSDDVKELITTAHPYKHRLELAAALSPADYAAWSLIFGTEALVKEQRHRDRLEILESNPLLLHAWYETCKEAGVPVREFGNRTEEEMEEFTQKAVKGKGIEGVEEAIAAGLQQAPDRLTACGALQEKNTAQLQAGGSGSAIEEVAQSPRKRQRFEQGRLEGSGGSEIAEQSLEDTRNETPAAGQGTEEERQTAGSAERKEEDKSPNACKTESPGIPPFEEVYQKFLKHRVVEMITTDLDGGYKSACEKGRREEWLGAHYQLLLSDEFVRVDFSLINGRNFHLSDRGQAAKPANALVRLVLAQFLEDLKPNGAAFADRDILTALNHELTTGRNPTIARFFAERAVVAKFCRGAGKKMLPFTLSGALPKVVSFSTGQERKIATAEINEAVKALDRGSSEEAVVFKPTSFQYRNIDAVQIVVRRPEKAADPRPSCVEGKRRAAYMKKNQKTLNDWVADRKLTIPPGLKRTKANLVALREADDKAKANVQPTGAQTSPSDEATSSATGGGQQATASQGEGPSGAGGEAGPSRETGSLDSRTEVHVYFCQVSLMKFEKHVFSTEGAMHQDYCRLWQPDSIPDSMIHFGMVYILPESRLPEPEKRECMVTGKDLALRGRDVQTLIKHRQKCMSFEQFDGELAMVDKLWRPSWVQMYL